LEKSARQDRIMLMQHFTSSTLDMIRQDPEISNVNLTGIQLLVHP